MFGNNFKSCGPLHGLPLPLQIQKGTTRCQQDHCGAHSLVDVHLRRWHSTCSWVRRGELWQGNLPIRHARSTVSFWLEDIWLRLLTIVFFAHSFKNLIYRAQLVNLSCPPKPILLGLAMWRWKLISRLEFMPTTCKEITSATWFSAMLICVVFSNTFLSMFCRICQFFLYILLNKTPDPNTMGFSPKDVWPMPCPQWERNTQQYELQEFWGQQSMGSDNDHTWWIFTSWCWFLITMAGSTWIPDWDYVLGYPTQCLFRNCQRSSWEWIESIGHQRMFWEPCGVGHGHNPVQHRPNDSPRLLTVQVSSWCLDFLKHKWFMPRKILNHENMDPQFVSNPISST